MTAASNVAVPSAVTAGRLHTITIDRLDDPRIADYANLKDADLHTRAALFIAEGPLVARELLRSRFPTRSVFIADTKLRTLAQDLATLPPHVPIYTATQNILDKIAGFHLHRGVLAAGQRTPEPDPIALIASARVLLILEDLSNHDNLGGLFRTAAALGGPHVGVLLSPRCCDPLYRKALRVSIGHVLHVPFARAQLDPALWQLLADHRFQLLSLTPDPLADPITSLSPGRNCALILGAEGPGLTPATMHAVRSAGGATVRIPMTPGVDSLNVVVAAGIALSRVANPMP